jgi:hypothetical protein
LKKSSKKLLRRWDMGFGAVIAPMNESFLLLFFKKAALAFAQKKGGALLHRPFSPQIAN